MLVHFAVMCAVAAAAPAERGAKNTLVQVSVQGGVSSCGVECDLLAKEKAAEIKSMELMVAEAKAEIAACIAMMKLKQEMIAAWEAQIHLKQSILSSLEAHTAAHADARAGTSAGALEHPHPHKKPAAVFAAPPPSAPPPPPTPPPPAIPPPDWGDVCPIEYQPRHKCAQAKELHVHKAPQLCGTKVVKDADCVEGRFEWHDHLGCKCCTTDEVVLQGEDESGWDIYVVNSSLAECKLLPHFGGAGGSGAKDAAGWSAGAASL